MSRKYERSFAALNAKFMDFCHSTKLMVPDDLGSKSVSSEELFDHMLSGLEKIRQERDRLRQKNKELNVKLKVKDREQIDMQRFPEKVIKMLPESIDRSRGISDMVCQAQGPAPSWLTLF